MAESITITNEPVQNEETRIENKSPRKPEVSVEDRDTESERNRMQTSGLQIEPVSANLKTGSAGGIIRSSLELMKQKSQGLPENTGLMIGEQQQTPVGVVTLWEIWL